MSADRREVLRRIAGEVSRETFDKLELFERRLLEWNQRINLVSRTDTAQLWNRHIADSAQLVRYRGKAANWLDIGSGGGFPGMVVAILLGEHGGTNMHLVESNRRKAAFLAKITAETGAPAQVHSCRVEDLHRRLQGVDIVSARAVADLKTLISLAFPWLQTGAVALFQKGRDYRREIEDCSDAWMFDLVEHASRTDPDGTILEISNLRSRGGEPATTGAAPARGAA